MELKKIFVAGKEQMVIDYFLSLCPKVMLQVDVGWVMYAGVDEAEFLKDHAQKTALVHLKDFHVDEIVRITDFDHEKGKLVLEKVYPFTKEAV